MYNNSNNYNSNNNPYNPYNNQINDYDIRLKNNYIKENINNKENKYDIKKAVIIIGSMILVILIFIIINNLLKSFTVHFELNGADEIESTELKCKSNIKGQCFLTLPIAKRVNGEVLGYSNKPYSKDIDYKIGEEIQMEEDMILYVISKKNVKINVIKDDIDEVKDINSNCDIYNTENYCDVNIPISNKLGYKINGYTKDKNNHDDLIYPGSEYKLKDNIDLYPVYSAYLDYYGRKNVYFNIEKSIYIKNSYLDVGYNCDSNIVSSLTANLKKAYDYFPFYAYYSKIILLSDKDFINYANNDTGIYGLTSRRDLVNPDVIVRCSEDLSSYLSTFHELSHAFDVRYKNVFGHFISEEDDVIKLRNKYKALKDKPLSDYAYDDKRFNSYPEFFAELMTYYYINYIDTTSYIGGIYKRGNYPDDMKNVAEKYICIAKNNFDKSNCS